MRICRFTIRSICKAPAYTSGTRCIKIMINHKSLEIKRYLVFNKSVLGIWDLVTIDRNLHETGP